MTAMISTHSPRTDHGRLYFKTPKHIDRPTSIEELASLLAEHNARGEPVTVRNHGFSTNGQTLTEGCQIQVGGIRRLAFDEERRIITAGCGNSWDSVIRGMGFPRFCPAVFPGGPGMQIHVGGTASVGGVGHYSSKYGGFWNQVRGLKLVTMTGEIIHCSPTDDGELFRYALGGYGRIGVIGELEIMAVPSKPKVFSIALLYADDDTFHADFNRALEDPELSGVIAGEDLSGWETELFTRLGIRLRMVVAMVEVDDGDDVDAIIDGIVGRYNEQSNVFMEAHADRRGLALRMCPKVHDKRGIVYYSMQEDGPIQRFWKWIQRVLLHREEPPKVSPFADSIVDAAHYRDFLDAASAMLRQSDAGKWLEKEAFVQGLSQIDSFITFGIKKLAKGDDAFPLSLDLPQEDGHARGVAIMPTLPEPLRDEGLALEQRITDMVYEMGGRRYLYGSHRLSREQVEKHYGLDVIHRWQQLKDELDPKHLLNLGVIEHLD
jgi:FAD/FMN-containing dehydrogenase